MLNQDKLNESQFLEDLQKLLDVYPVINKFDKAKSELFSKNDFDIFDEEQNDKKFLFITENYVLYKGKSSIKINSIANH